MFNTNNAATVTTLNAITVGDRLVLTKGCKARGLDKGITVRVESAEPMGAEYSHCARVVLKPLNGFKAGKTFVLFARHANRLADPIIRLNDGNPSNTIEVRRAAPR
jgi:hypothetical protein